MPTILTHAAVPLAIGLGLGQKKIPRLLLFAGVVASILPDIDVLTLQFHISYADAVGHRGLSHSLLFAICLGLFATSMAHPFDCSKLTTFSFIGICTASHGMLDMFTNGGLGVAIWSPFSTARYFAPWRMIEVSPLGLHRVWSNRGLDVIRSEFIWIWVPAVLVCMLLIVIRHSNEPST